MLLLCEYIKKMSTLLCFNFSIEPSYIPDYADSAIFQT